MAGADEELVTPSRIRLATAEHMVRTKRTAPHATTFMEVDMTNIARWLDKHKDEFRRKNGYGISYVPFVMKATCEGLRQFPMVNASWTADNKRRRTGREQSVHSPVQLRKEKQQIFARLSIDL